MDLTESEFAKYYLDIKLKTKNEPEQKNHLSPFFFSPTSVDWRTASNPAVINPDKN